MKKILLVLLLLVSFNANAWLWVEPYIGYDIGSKTEIANSSSELEYSGFTYGARLGWAWKILLLGVDLSGMSGTSTDEAGLEDDVSKSTFGAFAGVNFDLTVIGLRAWISYFFSNKLTFSNDNEMSGGGFGIGVGITLLKFLGINFEYRGMDYDEFVIAGNTNNFEYKPSEFVVSLSVPLDLF